MFQNSECANLYNKLLPLFTRILMNFLTFQSTEFESVYPMLHFTLIDFFSKYKRQENV